MNDGLLRISDVQRELQLSRATIQRAIRSGELPIFKFGRTIRIDRSDLEAWRQAKRGAVRKAA